MAALSYRYLKKYAGDECGKVLLVVLALSVLIQLFGGYLLTQTTFVGKHVRVEALRIQSEYLTEAGFQWALSQLSSQTYGEQEITISVPISDICDTDVLPMDDGQRFADGDIFRIRFLPLDAWRIKITVVTVWTSNELAYPVQNGVEAIVNKKTLNVEKKD